MEIEQPQLGCIGVDSFTVALDYHWEGGWTLRSSSRLSGSQKWRRTTYEALSHDEALEMAHMLAAEALGLI